LRAIIIIIIISPQNIPSFRVRVERHHLNHTVVPEMEMHQELSFYFILLGSRHFLLPGFLFFDCNPHPEVASRADDAEAPLAEKLPLFQVVKEYAVANAELRAMTVHEGPSFTAHDEDAGRLPLLHDASDPPAGHRSTSSS